MISSCSQAPKKSDDSQGLNPVKEGTDRRSSDQGTAMGLQTVHFDFDSVNLNPDSLEILKKNAEILKSNDEIKVQIEGYCDSRGGIQYNLGLGDKRAKAVVTFLRKLGVNSSKLSTVSYGKERPLDPSETEEAFAKNRRANFVVTAPLN